MKAIEFKDVEKNFKDGDQIVHALKKTNVSVDKGEFVAIIGPSGSGKSTFLTIAGGLQTPSKGSVLINGQEFSAQPENQRVIFRSYQCFDVSGRHFRCAVFGTSNCKNRSVEGNWLGDEKNESNRI